MKVTVNFKIEFDENTNQITFECENSEGRTAIHVFKNGSAEKLSELVYEANKAMSKTLNTQNLVKCDVSDWKET